ncbi:MAG: aminotransferase class I/II-fold pyridoxal phosphate-dependent enzyme [Pseudomonadales bacterium]|nr:aminotransferase class I/II-fold pyridoxal phosphate-dependent enzyme [Pseudomonadales bacterium]
MLPFRDEIEALQQNGITKVAFRRMGDPAVIPLWFGEGDSPTPVFVREAAKAALDAGQTFYSHTRGRPELRRALRTYLQNLYGIELDERRITVPGSAMLGVTIAAQTALTTGSHGLIVGPVWPNIDAVFRITGAEVSYVRQRLTGNGWQLSVREIIDAVRPNTRAIFVNSPCNPTGWVMAADAQAELLAYARERKVLIIADEVYHRTVFDTVHAPSFLQSARDDDPLVVVNGFSKAWAMTGWRIGWVVTPLRHEILWTALSECFNTTTNVFAQLGAVAALEQGEAFVAEQQQQFKQGRDLVDAALGSHPLFDHVSPEGAFYAFPRVRGLTDSLEFVEAMLEAEDVGVAPGYTFGPGNDAHFRICFAQSPVRLQDGLNRIVRFTEQRFG